MVRTASSVYQGGTTEAPGVRTPAYPAPQSLPAPSLPRRWLALALAKWIADDVRAVLHLARHPFSFGRWCAAADRKRLAAREPRLWLLVGDVAQLYVAARLAAEVRRHFDVKFVFSVRTRSLQRLARAELCPGDIVTDMPALLTPVLWRAVSLVRPLALLPVMGLWTPRLLWLARRRGITVGWVAAEMSQETVGVLRSFAGKCDLALLLRAIDVVCTNTDAEQKRLLSLGFRPESMHVTGPAKYDAAAESGDGSMAARAILQAAGIESTHRVLVGGNVAEGEDTALLEVYERLRIHHPELVLVIAPQDPDLAAKIVAHTEARGLTCVRRSRLSDAGRTGRPDVLLLDSVGELKGFYAWATVVFVGRSLSARTGSNLMEPAGYGRAIVVGPYFERFQEELDAFLAAGAVRQVENVRQLRAALARLLADSQLRDALGRRAAAVVQEKAGSLPRTVEFLSRAWRRTSARP